jgi:hypothetical protein
MGQEFAVYRSYYKQEIKSIIREEIQILNEKLHKLNNAQLKKTRRNNNTFS